MLALSPAVHASDAGPIKTMQAAMHLACKVKGRSDIALIGRRLPGVQPVDALTGDIHILNGRRQVYPLEIGRLTIDWLAPRGHLHHIRLQLDRADRGMPLLYVLVDHRCKVRTARRIAYDADDAPNRIIHLDPLLEPTGKEDLINPPVPLASDPGGEPVAIIDTGVNYLLPTLGPRLARDEHGALAGYDFWDLDRRPFDANPNRSAFFPARHGTEVASLIAAEAPIAKLLPYRYPHPDMQRLGDLVTHAAQQGVRVVNISLVSFHREDWRTFEAALEAHPDTLFVVAAGNDRRNIDERPVFPAALSFQNMITVTAATDDGRLAKRANWGASTVDLMAPADQIEVTSFDGSKQFVTGSSYAAARVTALAACLLAAYPNWPITKVKGRLFELAVKPSDDRLARIGFIPAHIFGQQGACSTRRPDGTI